MSYMRVIILYGVQGGWSPLHRACTHSNVACVKLLLDSKADVNAKTEV